MIGVPIIEYRLGMPGRINWQCGVLLPSRKIEHAFLHVFLSSTSRVNPGRVSLALAFHANRKT